MDDLIGDFMNYRSCEGKWIQSRAVKGYVIDASPWSWQWANESRIWVTLCPWYHCAFGWMETRMVIRVAPQELQFLDQEEATLYILSNLGK